MNYSTNNFGTEAKARAVSCSHRAWSAAVSLVIGRGKETIGGLDSRL